MVATGATGDTPIAVHKSPLSLRRHHGGMPLHPAVQERLARLAPDQRDAATAPPGPILCVAPAGSGKTTTLVARICWLLGTGATQTGRLAALTFNKRAALELAERLSTALAPLDLPGGSDAAVRV